MSSPWRVRDSSRLSGSGQSRTTMRPPGRRASNATRRACDRIGQLVQGVLEVGQIEVGVLGLAGRRHLADLDALAQALGGDGRPGSGDGVRLGLDPDELELREAPGHGHQPAATAAVDIDHLAAPGQVRHQLGQRRQGLLEEDRDVLAGEPLDGHPVAIRSLGQRPPGPEEVGHGAPVHGCRHGMDELATQVVRPVGVEQDLGHGRLPDQAAILVGQQVMGVGGPRPGLDRPQGRCRSPRPDRRRSCQPDPAARTASNSPRSRPRWMTHAR